MYRISICYGQMRSADSLERVLNCYFKAKGLVAEIRKFNQLSDMIRCRYTADVTFLDANTALKDGFALAQFLFKCNPSRYLYIIGDKSLPAEEQMGSVAFRYLERPVNLDELYHLLNAVLDRQGEVDFTSNYLNVTLKEDEIVCIYSLARKTYVMTDKGELYPTINSMKIWNEKISGFKNFYHPHYSYIINSRYINSFDGRTIVMKCVNGREMNITPSQRKMAEFRNLYYEKIRACQ